MLCIYIITRFFQIFIYKNAKCTVKIVGAGAEEGELFLIETCFHNKVSEFTKNSQYHRIM